MGMWLASGTDKNRCRLSDCHVIDLNTVQIKLSIGAKVQGENINDQIDAQCSFVAQKKRIEQYIESNRRSDVGIRIKIRKKNRGNETGKNEQQENIGTIFYARTLRKEHDSTSKDRQLPQLLTRSVTVQSRNQKTLPNEISIGMFLYTDVNTYCRK